jgi:hypothetical protein
MTGFEWFLVTVLVGMFILTILSNGAAYRNGVTDGYGYSKEPSCPGYRAAGEYLVKYMSHRWPELKACTYVFPVPGGVEVAVCDCDTVPGEKRVLVPAGQMVYVCGRCRGAKIYKK